MSKVLPFTRPGSERYSVGEAFCLQCHHVWQVAAPAGVTRFECPECHTKKGLMRFECAPDEPVWTCNCGNQLFYLTQNGHLCANCGVYQTY